MDTGSVVLLVLALGAWIWFAPFDLVYPILIDLITGSSGDQ